jgi:ATP-dependent Clp protease adaptor protein ClpS
MFFSTSQTPEPPGTPTNPTPPDDGQGAVVAERQAARVEPPPMYQVVLLNDDYTPMEFVVMVLQEYFKLDLEAATQIMLKIHHEGRGVCGVFSKDVAATKVELVSNAARRGGHPLQCIMEAA